MALLSSEVERVFAGRVRYGCFVRISLHFDLAISENTEMRFSLARTLDVVLVLCAVTTTGVLITRFTRPAAATSPGAMAPLNGWKNDLTFDRRVGGAQAPYRLVVWTDYQCPACRQFESEIDSAKTKLGDSLSVIYRYYPLPGHPLAFRAAMAAECARTQGRFEAMHKTLFAAFLSGDSLPLKALSDKAEIPDPVKFTACVRDSTTAASIRTDLKRGREIKIAGTPGVQIGNKFGVGAIPTEELLPMLRRAQ